jgi:hypothetical protein
MSAIKFQKRTNGPYLVARLHKSLVLRAHTFVIRLVSADGAAKTVARGTVRLGQLFTAFDRVPLYVFHREVERIVGPELISAIDSARRALEVALESLGHDEVDYPLTVFAQTSARAESAPWCEALQALFVDRVERRDGRDYREKRPVEVVIFPARPAKGLVPLEPRFSLPVNIVAPPDLVSSLLSDEYYLRDEDVAKHVLSVQPLAEGHADHRGTDLSIKRFADEYTALEWLQDRRSATRVRVAVLPFPSRLPRPLQAVAGTACIVVGGVFYGEVERHFFQKFMRELVHDRPLSTVLSIALRETNARQSPYGPRFPDERFSTDVRLYCDPSTDNWLRFSSALPLVTDAAHLLRHFVNKSDGGRLADELLQLRGESSAVGEFAGALKAAAGAVAPSLDVLNTGIQFTRESTGVQPMAQVLKSSKSREVAAFHAQLEALRDKPELLSALEVAQQRRVDAQLEMLLDGNYVVNYTYGVLSGAQLRLTIHIGQKGQQSLMSEDVPALDPMLPELAPNESHDIDIVVFPKDFTLLQTSPACQTVKLPRFSGSEPSHWNLRAPVLRAQQNLPEDASVGPDSTRTLEEGDEAELRFNVYFKNQLLQSFSVTATVHDKDYWMGKTSAVCDFSQTRRFGFLDDLAPRFATLALNKGHDDSHLLSLRDSKREGCSVEWQGSFLTQRLAEVREALWQSLAPSGDSPFGFDPGTLACTPQPDSFEIAVRRLARTGASLCNQLALKSASQEVLELLDEIQQSSDRTIQVALLDPSYSLPWGLLYDYKVFSDDWPKLPICNGYSAPETKCKCQPDAGTTICLRGFWGFRHYVEQLCGVNETDPAMAKVIAGKPTNPALAFVQAISDDFSNNLKEQLGPEAQVSDGTSSPTQLLEKYRDAQGRPSVILFMGHLEQTDVNDAGSARLLNHDGSTFLAVDDIGYEVRKQHFWEQPRSLVLLIACGSGQQGPAAGVGLSGGLVRLNAIGVLATECTVFTGIGSRVARDVLMKLKQPLKPGHPEQKPVGVALREVVWELAREGCPLGLAFTYVGSMEATLP